MKTIFNAFILAMLLVVAASPCCGMMSIVDLSKERAKELGIVIRSNPAGPDAVRVELELEAKGELKKFSRVDLEFREGGKFLVTSSLREQRSSPARVVVSCAVNRAHLDNVTLRVVVQAGPRDMVGYELRVGNFVEREKIR